jgi:hypothetical protein
MKDKVEVTGLEKDLPDPIEVLRIMLNTPPQPFTPPQKEKSKAKTRKAIKN